jgi:DNA polymerase V
MKSLFALVDCNNFYVSCERLFRPDLKLEPVAVLSNNDGCIVARSQEVKDLGIKMGTPLFKVADLISKHHVQVFSSNYTLYGDISARVMQTLEEYSPLVEVYSIDEAFLDLSGIAHPEEHGKTVRQTVMKNVGVPVCVGIAPTKTLAKLANYAAKKYKKTGGVVDLTETNRRLRLMEITPVSEVWGVGRRLSKSLQAIGVTKTLQLANLNPRYVRKRFNVVLERTVRELNGESCLELDDVAAKRQQIICSRSFGTRLTKYNDIKEAVCEFIARAATKLRGENQLANMLSVFIRTSAFDHSASNYSNIATARLPQASSDTRILLEVAIPLLNSIWKEGHRYAKAGVMLNNFCNPEEVQFDLFKTTNDSTHSDSLMQVVDMINHGKLGKIWFGGQRPQQNWFMKQTSVSPAYTTRWDCLPEVK